VSSVQVRGLYAVAFPIIDTGGCAVAALTVPYAERIDLAQRCSIAEIEEMLSRAAGDLSARMGERPGGDPRCCPAGTLHKPAALVRLTRKRSRSR